MQEFFTIEETAERLNFTVDQVRKEIKKNEFEIAYNIQISLKAKDKTTGRGCSIPEGIYVIDVFPYSEMVKVEERAGGEETGNYHNVMQSFRVLEWDINGTTRINELSVYELCDQVVLEPDEWAAEFCGVDTVIANPAFDYGVVAIYVLDEAITVSMENVLIPRWSLKNYLEANGRNLDTAIAEWAEKNKTTIPGQQNKTEKRALTPAEEEHTNLKVKALNHLRNKDKGASLKKLVDEDLAGLFKIKGQVAYRLLVESGFIKDSKNLIAQQDAESDKMKKKAIGKKMKRELFSLKNK